MKRQLNHFEAKAYNAQFKSYQRPSWEHTADTYTGNNAKNNLVTIASIFALVVLVIVALITL